jgi:hypothetical protein
MTLSEDQAAARLADAQQAAYFRTELDAARRNLEQGLIERRALIAGGQSGRLNTELHSAEAELRYLDRLIARIDDRFATGQNRHELLSSDDSSRTRSTKTRIM